MDSKFVGVRRSPRESMGVRGSPWESMESEGNLWESRGSTGVFGNFGSPVPILRSLRTPRQKAKHIPTHEKLTYRDLNPLSQF